MNNIINLKNIEDFKNSAKVLTDGLLKDIESAKEKLNPTDKAEFEKAKANAMKEFKNLDAILKKFK